MPNEFLFSSNGEKPVVYLDDRELRSACVQKLFDMGAELQSKRLLIGDYVLSPRVCVERKTTADFESSIIDGRLFQQAGELVSNFQAAIICVVGEGFERIRPEALRGAFISLAVDYRLPLFFFDSEEELAEFIYALAFKEQLKKKTETALRFMKKKLTLSDQQQFIAESLPMIGPKTAKKLLTHFGSLQSLFTADEKQLRKAEGVGKARAQVIRKVISEKYGEEESEEVRQEKLG